MTKIPSKNSLCPCGSGKRYRKCCRGKRPPRSVIDEAAELFRKREQQKRDFVERHGHVRPPSSVKAWGKVLTAVEGGIYQQTREGPYNFLNAIHDHALLFFGQSFLESEEAKAFSDRHIAIQWMHTYVDYTQKPDRPLDRPIGAGAAWFRFAYDLFTIRDNAKLQARLKERLISQTDFQSARHELKIAALFVAAGFDLQFEDETDNVRSHPEFVGTDRFSTARIAVEVKSRHRRGVQGFQGGSYANPGESVNVRSLVLEAYKKTSDLPLYVFVDLNLPPLGSELHWHRWNNELDKTMADLQAEGYANPCPANIVFFSNDPSHYLIEHEIGKDADNLWIKYYRAEVPRIAHPPTDIATRFMNAHQQRVVPPAAFPSLN